MLVLDYSCKSYFTISVVHHRYSLIVFVWKNLCLITKTTVFKRAITVIEEGVDWTGKDYLLSQIR